MNTAFRLRAISALAVVALASYGANVAVSAATTTPQTTKAASNNGVVTMPLEVMGDAGTVIEATLNVNNGASAARLWFQANNLSYDNKASVQVNNGPWVNVTNASAAVEGAGKSYGGIGGGYNTLKLSVPIKGAVNGSNTIRFRFNGTDGVSSGFRVLAFNLLDGNGQKLIADTSFTQDDPTRWTAPLSSTADIAAGEKLWRTATLRESSLGGARQLQAHCMDCHAQDGRDLQRFNYSNNAIIVRSKFHGLSDQQGQQIASYIRSLTAKLGVPGDNCRPWNPPYQPGPGLDSRPVADWTCGAGLQAVSDNDMDTMNAVFGGSVNRAAIATKGELDVRNIPIGLQLPDWQHWLPRIHPKDAWGSAFTNSALNKAYAGEGNDTTQHYNLRDKLSKGGADYVTNPNSTFRDDLYYWGVDLGERFPYPNKGTDYQFSVAQQKNIYGTLQWQLLKSWELAQEFNLETLCPQAYRNMHAPKVEARSWCGHWRFAFDVSPHIQKFPPANSMFGSTVAHYYYANVWYEVQVLLNPGSGAQTVHLPVDWQYTYGLVDDLSKVSGRTEPMRNLLLVAKGAQEMDNGVGVKDVDNGWNNRNTNPMAVWKDGAHGIWAGVADNTRKSVVNAYLQDWLDTSESFNVNDWQRTDGPGSNETCGWSIYRLCSANYTLDSVVNFPSESMKEIPQMRADGIDGNLLNRYARLLNSWYPRANFQNLVK